MRYFNYVIKNVEPLRIADDSTSQSGQTMSLRYIPGTTIRGYVVNRLANQYGEQFDNIKATLLSDKVKFMNAYMYVNGKTLLPSPKGFYEDKTVTDGKKPIQNVVINGKFDEGNKRAGLGRFCYIDKQCIYYYNVNSGSDMKHNVNSNHNDQNIFRSEYIGVGNTFSGYIAIDDDNMYEDIANVFGDYIVLGNARSQGMGKCIVLEKQSLAEEEIPYSEYIVDTDVSGCCYMMLLSNTSMRGENGQNTGIDLNELGKLLEVTDLHIAYCSTSTVDVKGYNRTWGSKIPSVTMYEQGSVFKLEFSGTISYKKMMDVMNEGLGIRKNEGFGRVIFIKDYESIAYKQEGSRDNSISFEGTKRADDDKCLKLIAKNYYRKLLQKRMKEQILNKAHKLELRSQVGNIRALLEENRYDAVLGTQVLKDYFGHKEDKDNNRKSHKKSNKKEPFIDVIMNILDNPLTKTLGLDDKTEVMGFSVKELMSDEALQRMKFDYILEIIKYSNRKG